MSFNNQYNNITFKYKNKSGNNPLNSVFLTQKHANQLSDDLQDPLLTYHKKIRTDRKEGYKSESKPNIQKNENDSQKSILHHSQNTFGQTDEQKNGLSQYELFESTDKLIELASQQFYDQKDSLTIPQSYNNNSNYSSRKVNSTQNALIEHVGSNRQSSNKNNRSENARFIISKSIQSSPSKISSSCSVQLKNSKSEMKLLRDNNNELPQIGSNRQFSRNNLNIGMSFNDLKSESFGRMTEKTDRQNIFLKQQEDKIKLLHVDLKSSIDRLNNQQMVKDAANVNSQVDSFLAGGIAFSKSLGKTANNSSLNQKLMEEGIISNTSQVSFIKKRNNIKQDKETKADEYFDELNGQSAQKIQIKSKNDLDSILRTERKKERKEIISRVNKILEEKRKKDSKQQDNYNKWYIDPEFRNKAKVDRSEKLYPYVFDQSYLYNNIDNYEDLYNDNPFDTNFIKQKQSSQNQKSAKLEHLRSVVANLDVIREYTKKLLSRGERIPLFMKEVFSYDTGKIKARTSLLNRYYNKSEEFNKFE